MTERVSAEHTAELLLWYFREPSRYHAEGRRRSAPQLDSEVVLKLALGRRIAFAKAALNAPGLTRALQDAAAAYVRHLYFRPDATPYQTLGLAAGATPQEIKESFRLLMHLVHPDRQDAVALWPDAFAAQANRAYAVLRNQDARARLDREAEKRAAVARAVHRAAAESAASMLPVVVPRARRWGRRPLSRPALPEWLTAGVGGFAREHPAPIAFAVLIAGAALVVGAMSLEGPEALVWDATGRFATMMPAAAGPAEASVARDEQGGEAIPPVAASPGDAAIERAGAAGSAAAEAGFLPVALGDGSSEGAARSTSRAALPEDPPSAREASDARDPAVSGPEPGNAPPPSIEIGRAHV
jgi:curved DNA-binding protein CbpA